MAGGEKKPRRLGVRAHAWADLVGGLARAGGNPAGGCLLSLGFGAALGLLLFGSSRPKLGLGLRPN